MTEPVLLLLILLGLAMTGALLYLAFAVVRLRGPRIVTCPEAKRPVKVELASGAALSLMLGQPRLRLSDCSRWPERQGCGQACRPQIAQAPADCLVVNILKSWYRGKVCSICGAEFGEIGIGDHRPALLDADGRTWDWDEFSIPSLPEVLDSHEPVCWECHIAASLDRLHPDWIVHRPDGWQKMSSLYH